MKAALAELFRRPDGRGSVLWIDDQKRPVFGAKKARGVKCLQRPNLPGAFHRLADRDEGRNIGIPGAERLRDYGAEMWHRHRLWRDVPGVPMILMPRVEDEPEIRGRE